MESLWLDNAPCQTFGASLVMADEVFCDFLEQDMVTWESPSDLCPASPSAISKADVCFSPVHSRTKRQPGKPDEDRLTESAALSALLGEVLAETLPEEMEVLPTQQPCGKWRKEIDRQEHRRRQQRGYERSYRKKKQLQVKELKVEWVKQERIIKAETALVASSIQLPSGQCGAAPQSTQIQYENLLREYRALLLDQMLLKSLNAVYTMATLRQYHNIRVLRSKRTWDFVSGKAFSGQNSSTLFTPFQFQFTW